MATGHTWISKSSFFLKKKTLSKHWAPLKHWFLTVFAGEWGTSTPSSIRIQTVHHIYHIINYIYIYVYAYYVQTWHLIFWDNKETHVKRLGLSKDRWWSSCFLKLLLGGKTNFQRHTHTRDMFYIYICCSADFWQSRNVIDITLS